MIDIDNLKIEDVEWKEGVEYGSTVQWYKKLIEKHNSNVGVEEWAELFYNKALNEGEGGPNGENSEEVWNRVYKEFGLDEIYGDADTGFLDGRYRI